MTECAASRSAEPTEPRGDCALAASGLHTPEQPGPFDCMPLTHPTGERDAQNLLSGHVDGKDWSMAAAVAAPPQKQVSRGPCRLALSLQSGCSRLP